MQLEPVPTLFSIVPKIIEDHFGIRMPSVLKEFYADPSKVLQQEFEIEIRKPIEGEIEKRVHVQNFAPMNDFSIELSRQTEGFLAIAGDGGGGSYMFNPKSIDAEIHYYFVQDGAIFPTGLTLIEFLKGPRHEATWGVD
ncbi:MAG: hypothetical protein ABIT37_16160 [Luteolibacter sp.]